MGVDIDGCVEVKIEVAPARPPEWVGIVLIRDLVERNYRMFGVLLDVRTPEGVAAPFANRGLPYDVSGETSYQASTLGAGMVKPSWALWSEIGTIKQEIASIQQFGYLPGWQACFDMMEAIAKHFGDDNVRLVAWCDSE